MCKKLGVTALVVVAGLFVLHKLDLLGYVKMYANKAKQSANESIPPEVKLDRLRAELAQIPDSLKKQRTAIAGEMTEINRLKTQLAESKTNLDKKEALLKDLRKDLDKGITIVSTDGTKIPREKVEASLARQWESYKTSKEAVKSQEDLLRSREEALEIAKAKLDAVQDKKKEMEAKVEKMDLELRKLRLAQTQNNIAVDDSQLAEVMKLYDEVDRQIQTQQNELALQKAVDTDMAVEQALAKKAKTDQALKDMDEYFGSQKVSKKD